MLGGVRVLGEKIFADKKKRALGVFFGDIGTSPLYVFQTGVAIGGKPGGFRGELLLFGGFGFWSADGETDGLRLAPLAALEIDAPEVVPEGLHGGDFAIFGTLGSEGFGAVEGKAAILCAGVGE